MNDLDEFDKEFCCLPDGVVPYTREELLKNGYRTFKKKDERQIELDNLIRELERDIEDE